MMNFNLLQWLLILSFFPPSIVKSDASHSSISLLGVSPKDEEYYSISSEIIKCKDGSKKFNRSQLNDDFCDCPDGSDEPGTSACPNGRFHCRNVGHMSLILFSSRVNDGICDCCDGSDEYDGKIKCSNTCWEAGTAAKDKLKKKIATYQDGVTLRKKEIEQAKQAFVKDEVELSKLKDEEKILKGLVQQLKDRKDQIEKVEEEERLEKEKKEKLPKKEAEKESDQEEKAAGEEKESGEENTDDTTHAVASDFDASIDQGDEQVDSKIEHGDSSDEVKEGSNFNAELNNEGEVTVASESANDPEHEHDAAGTENTEGLSKEELGRLVASRWTGDKNDQNTEGTVGAKEIGGAEETPKSEKEDDYNGYASELDEPGHHYDEPDSEDHTGDDSNEEDHGDSTSYKSDADEESFDSDLTASRNPSWLEKIQNTVKSLLHSVNLFQTPMNISDAARVRKEYDESSGKLLKIESRISSLSEKLKLDFGPEKEFYSLHGHCFETKQKQYVYKVCPYKKATQEEGHRTTRLGSWEKFENSYKAMYFSNGDTCWNGPDRSLKVRLRCGLKNELTDIDEPSRCEYVALLSTPSVCHEEKLKELRRKLDALNVEPLRGHDEL